mmetsp:Transcript_27614/g.41451  ORF Transcript_27614/g.41451 Transcript_27614/m.41451 type:complete len:299 (+) Transcript_27614:155-1051(+)
MSTTEATVDGVCASCGIAGGCDDDTKLKRCGACGLVRYCGLKCQRDHRPEHKSACKKRVAELRDEILFKQPEGIHFGDCPICFIPLPLDAEKSTINSCCCKVFCFGCLYECTLMENTKEICPFCRTSVPKTQAEAERNFMKRIEANDPVAMRQMGAKSKYEGDYSAAFEYWTKAAKLGDAESHNQLSLMYLKGNGVEKDEGKEIYHLEKAAIAGHHLARYNLAMHEGGNGRYERAVKHLIIGANFGHDGSIQKLKESYMDGDVSKEDFAAALRAYQAAMVAMKSPQREAAEAAEAASR